MTPGHRKSNLSKVSPWKIHISTLQSAVSPAYYRHSHRIYSSMLRHSFPINQSLCGLTAFTCANARRRLVVSASSLSTSSHATTSATAAASPLPSPSLDKVLIANRGEIACRVIRTCRRLGIPTVAIYSTADTAQAVHARLADEAHRIGTGPAPTDSYLRQDEVLEICAKTGAQAIHPGYGFLSENATFALKVQDAGLRFVGPPASAMQAMGSKWESKAIMEQAGVPTTPGYYGDGSDPMQQDTEFLRMQAIEKVGFPLLIKAVMGGGGKGMRLVWNESEFVAALESCQREAQSAFGDASVLLERYLVKPRHVEVQVIADMHGNVVHLNERDCSLQRRHQKIIEEAPASDLDVALRQEFGEMAKRAAQAVGYVNAGTVEFLLDTATPNQFYFCEMNTRLQVEHPISEEITGIDLVEWQLRIAAGEPLPILEQDAIPCRGHAFEARIYAENPARNFLPAAGRVWHHAPPVEINAGLVHDRANSESGVRVDTGLESGQDVGVYYDPMISKLIVHGPDRTSALNRLVKALKHYQIAGVPNNIDFLIKCAEHPTFGIAGAINTGFLEDFADDVKVPEDLSPPALAQAVGAFAALLLLEKRIDDPDHGVMSAPWSTKSGSWRMGGELGRAKRKLVLQNDLSVVCISNRDGSFEIHTGDEQVFHVAGELSSSGNMQVLINGSQRITLTCALRTEGKLIQIRMWPDGLADHSWSVDVENPLIPDSSESLYGGIKEGLVKAPMPGKISRINNIIGDTVKKDQVVMVMEAMKMEHAIKAPCDGTLAEARFKAGDVVGDGAVLFVVDSGDSEPVSNVA